MKEPSPLYPQAKTFEQKREEDAERQKRYSKRLPRFAWFGVPVFGTLLFLAVVSFVYSLPLFWQNGSQAMIFFSFFIWVVIAGLFVAWGVYASNSLYAYAASLRFFWIGYICNCTLLLILAGFGVLYGIDPWVRIGIFTGFHFALLGGLSWLLLYVNRKYPLREK